MILNIRSGILAQWLRLREHGFESRTGRKKKKVRASEGRRFNHCSVIVTASDQCEIATWAI